MTKAYTSLIHRPVGINNKQDYYWNNLQYYLPAASKVRAG
jgi:hypothetical protein